MSHLNTAFDPDYDSFLNLDNDFTPTSTSPSIKPVPMLTPQSATTFASSSTSQTFPGPSFQYDAYHQQTGIPIGALATTFNINKASGLQYHEGNGGFVMPTETLNMPLSNLDEFDFSRNPSDMDLDTDSPNDLPTMFYPDRSSGPAQFVSPNTLVAQGNKAPTPIQRIYPGMHSQQAAQAKAQQAQKQEQMARQQKRPQGQKSLPGPATTKAQPAKDPLVEESISKVLNRMRQASVASTADDDDSTPVSGMSNMPRIKKDEDDMDEDERLLASEEGKKLSSKERRQLRNKVSARAFRSRRKGKSGILSRILSPIDWMYRIHWSTRRRSCRQSSGSQRASPSKPATPRREHPPYRPHSHVALFPILFWLFAGAEPFGHATPKCATQFPAAKACAKQISIGEEGCRL